MYKRQTPQRLLLLSSLFLSQSLFASGQVTDAVAPEQTSAISEKKLVTAQHEMVATANPIATQVGYDVLKSGGSAIDALVAVQMTLGLVEPQSSGLGGGAFAVYYDAKNKQLTTFDGRETAPMKATPELFQDNNGKPLKFYDAVVGGRSVGTPGTIKLMAELHKRYGRKPWSDLLKPAEKIALDGFIVSPRLAHSVESNKAHLSRYPETKAYFFNLDNSPIQAGQRLKNLAYARTLSELAMHGPDIFYHGKIGKDIVRQVNHVVDNPGVLSEADLANYQVKQRKPVCLPYKQYDICGMGPPSSGGLTVGQIMGITEQFNLAKMGPNSPEAWQIIGDASRLAFADRGRYMADTDYVPMPQGLLDPSYLKARAQLIPPGKALAHVAVGEPEWRHPVKQADDIAIEFPSTSHIVIIDKDGNAVSITTTIESAFGSKLMVDGFLLNNELTDFSFKSYENGYPIANRLEPGKRPRSSMSPTIVMKEGKPYLLIGSPGGSSIIGYVVKTLIANLEWGMNIQQAISLPNAINRFGTFELEKGTKAEALKEPLEKMGYKVAIKDLNSGAQGIEIQSGKLYGGADPRREGLVLGD
ncbi:Gamma-glutamyltranspeptidase precursor [Marinomonas spartinae]|uniref:gamma-glutamyltransferase n=1 Tax=Marinomonas spartinae TaxID=1792290 RepID=UPI000808E078|nr:gamma-glutamyltransferase [Marinomonas spartinae]SBS30035.1 Gamma-glutamyltranspeptidase precursor [Marinomonas spartinae]